MRSIRELLTGRKRIDGIFGGDGQIVEETRGRGNTTIVSAPWRKRLDHFLFKKRWRLAMRLLHFDPSTQGLWTPGVIQVSFNEVTGFSWRVSESVLIAAPDSNVTGFHLQGDTLRVLKEAP